MANWNLPTITSGYLDFVTQMNDKFTDTATLLFGAPTNLPANSFRYNRSTNIFEEWDLTTWNPKVISVLGGGTGSNTAAGARTNLGLGSMATQNSNAVNITGGTITGVNLDGGAITQGIVALARGGTGSSLSLPPGGYVFVSSGVQFVTDSGISIAQLNANSLVAGTVNPARLPANVAYVDANNGFTGSNVFSGQVTVNNSALFISSLNPQIYMFGQSGAVNQRKLLIMNYMGQLVIQQQNDDSTFKANPFVILETGQLQSTDASGLVNLDAGNLGLGTVPIGRLGTNPGSANSGTYLRGDNVWAPATGSTGTPIPSGMISAFDVACPAGWTRYSGLDGRFPLGSAVAGQIGGSTQHNHHLNLLTDSRGSHAHSFSGSVSGTTTGASATDQVNQSPRQGYFTPAHTHDFNASFSGSTGGVGDHNHNTDGYTDNVDQYPPWYSVVYCRKD